MYPFLLALQAAGMIVDYVGKNNQVNLSKTGANLERNALNANLKLATLQYEDESLQAMRQLRQNLGTQAAILAARGTRGNAGSALMFSQESIGNFNKDEQMRKINLLSNEAKAKAGLLMSSFHQQAFKNEQWNQFRSNLLNKIPTSPQAWDAFKQEFGFGITKG